MAAGKVAYRRAEGTRLDQGDPAGYLEAVLKYADTQASLKPVLDKFLSER
jgi:UTP-glucose-1-phosphate uridylyltransferase